MDSVNPCMLDFVNQSLAEFPASPLLDALRKAFHQERAELQDIEYSFAIFTRDLPRDLAPYFFHNWSMTNHSAMAVSAMGNKMSMLLGAGAPQTDAASLTQALVSLHRISDEDLGATGGTMHQELFYEMAYAFTGSDDWQSRRYLLDAAREFKEYRYRTVVKNRDQLHALLATAVHEVYTHAEVEYILPLFQTAIERMGLSGREAARATTWIKVHCGGVEHMHFSHALQAIESYAKALGAQVQDYDLESIFCDYIRRKADVMRALSQLQEPENKAA